MLENTEGSIKNGQSRETGNIGYTRRRQTKQTHNTIFKGFHNDFFKWRIYIILIITR